MKKILSRLRRAIDEFEMIEEGERVAVGVSGGKDSLTLLVSMIALKKFYPKKFELSCVTLDMGLSADYSKVLALCEENDIPFLYKESNLGKILFETRKEKNPCALCAKMRRGMLHDMLLEHGIKKIALGHHFDDVVETFFLSMFFEGRLHTFAPVTKLSRTDITQIRPLIYIKEKEIISFAKSANLPVVFNPCPANGKTKRQDLKELVALLEAKKPGISETVFSAINRSLLPGWGKGEISFEGDE